MSKEASQLLDMIAEWQWACLKRETESEAHWADICRWHAAKLIGRGV